MPSCLSRTGYTDFVGLCGPRARSCGGRSRGCGALLPDICRYLRSGWQRGNMWPQLGADVLTVLNGPMDSLDGPLDAWLTAADLPLQPIADVAIDAAANDSQQPEVMRWGAWMIAQEPAIPDVLPTPLQAFRIGIGGTAWYLVASAHEVVADFSARVRGIWPYQRLTVVAYSNSQLSYLPSQVVLANPTPCTNFPFCTNNYEGGNSFVWYGHRGPLTPDAEDVFLEGHIALLDHGWE